ncbi:MAG: DUF177 domain-containing protein [Actinobacteria bacterium]|nr:DUF177 domain-containing protein [Actinomycetota bacterium]
MSTVDLRRFRLRAGEVRHELLTVEVEPFSLGGQRYEAVPDHIPVVLEVSQASGAMVFDLRFEATLSGPCMRCLGHAEARAEVKARELHDHDPTSADELRSEYVADDRLDIGAWVRDAIALALPEQILCRPECAGLCPVCGKDLNIEPHEHVDEVTDPRWAALEQLRDEL